MQKVCTIEIKDADDFQEKVKVLFEEGKLSKDKKYEMVGVYNKYGELTAIELIDGSGAEYARCENVADIRRWARGV